MIVRKFKITGIDFHFTSEYALEFGRVVVPCGNLLWTGRQLAIRRNDAEFFLARKGLFAKFIPPLVKLAFVLIRPLFRHVMRRMCCSGSEIHEERLVGGQ